MELYSKDITTVYALLKKEYVLHRVPVVELIEIQTKDPFKVLVATILSARTKDQTTAAAAKRLFTTVFSPADFTRLSLESIEKLIYPVGFYREKARHLKELPATLDTLFHGIIPDSVEELVRLPGVGRKTANLVVAVAFNKPAVCVDIHVHRIFNRLGYLVTKTPFHTEITLRQNLPRRFWTTFNSYFVSFGQHTCSPVSPHCNRCAVTAYCSRVGVTTKHSLPTR